jgi:hypothetical protein
LGYSRPPDITAVEWLTLPVLNSELRIQHSGCRRRPAPPFVLLDLGLNEVDAEIFLTYFLGEPNEFMLHVRYSGGDRLYKSAVAECPCGDEEWRRLPGR